MKKLMHLFMVLLLVFLSACSKTPTDVSQINSTTSNDALSQKEENNDIEKTINLPLSNGKMEFSFLSGAGGWRTIITLNSDGTFTGFYLDSEMGSIGENYPKGTAYTSTFSGEFTNIKKVNEFSYQMELTNLKTEKTNDETWIEDEIKYIASEPYGFESGTDFIFYLPETPISNLPEEFLSWWPYRYGQASNPKTTLSTYGILNVTTNYGFFFTE